RCVSHRPGVDGSTDSWWTKGGGRAINVDALIALISSGVVAFLVGAVCYCIELPADPEVPLVDIFEAAVAALRLSLCARRPPASPEAPT
ncbi:unnamed protein product, partial [Polarella glacialis]